MSRIRGRHTTPERILRSALWRAGLRYRLHARTPAGRPDIVFPGARVAVFVDGCFWHGCPDHYVRPRGRGGFWRHKLAENVARDRKQTIELEAAGWRVCRVWECEVIEKTASVAQRIELAVQGSAWNPGVSWRVVQAISIDRRTKLERRRLVDLRDESCLRTELRVRTTAKARANPGNPKAARARARR